MYSHLSYAQHQRLYYRSSFSACHTHLPSQASNGLPNIATDVVSHSCANS